MPIRQMLVVGVLASLIGFESANAAPQLDAGDAPTVRGPLLQAGKGCRRIVETHEGETSAVARSCIRFYRFRRGQENDENRNYGVAWLQTVVDASRGWCVVRANTDITMPNNVRFHTRRPRITLEPSQPHDVATRLVVDAEGHAARDGVIKQTWTLYPRLLSPKRADSGRIVRLHWEGREGAKLAFVSGIETSWRSTDDPGAFSGGVNFDLVERNNC